MEMDEAVKRIPVPSALPEKADLSNIPEGVLRSGAVESLIQQNDDLMARLSVSLRRISALEERLSQHDKINNKIKHHYESLKDQVLILNQKTESLQKRKLQAESEAKTFQERANLLEVQYAKDYTEAKERIAGIESQMLRLQRRLKRYLNYRNAARKKINELKKQISAVRQELEIERTRTGQLNEKIEESIDYIQTSGKAHKKEIQDLVDAYEAKLKEQGDNLEIQTQNHKKEVDQLSVQITEYKQQVSDYDELYKRLTAIENELIFVKRKRLEDREKWQSDLARQQTDVQHYRAEFRKLSEENGQLLTESESNSVSLDNLQEQVDRLNEQLLTTQNLLRESEQERESFVKKNEALQNLNRQLSIKLNETSGRLKKLKENLDNQYLSGSKKSSEDVEEKVNSNESVDGDAEKLLSNVDRLIAEIQSGFSHR